jgi:hypothetical protein
MNETELLALWEERDRRYRQDKRLTHGNAELDAVRIWRLREANAIGSVRLIDEAARFTIPSSLT